MYHATSSKVWVDWTKLRETIVTSTKFLDDVIDANAYVPAVPQLKEAALKARRIGLGIMGLADMMYALGIRYGSDEGQEFAAQIMEFVRYHCMATSIHMAGSRGAFPAITGSIYDPNNLKWQPPTPLLPYSRDWERPTLNWNLILDGIKRNGIRNAAQTTIAPTGTIATVAGIEGYGCEPVFALGYIRHFKDGDKDVELAYTSPLFTKALETTDLSSQRKDEILRHVAAHGGCQDITDLPEHVRNTFVVSSDITPQEHVLMQAYMQAFVDNSLSKTCNFPKGATEANVAKAYLLAWETGCKGLTVYVTGSREQVVLETKATKDKKFTVDPVSIAPPAQHKEPRPAILKGATYHKETPAGTAYVTVNGHHSDPFEVFLTIGKAGSEVAAVSEAIGRLISLHLRTASQVPAWERLQAIVDELKDIGGSRPLGFGPNRVRSLPDGIAQVLQAHLDGAAVAAEKAPAPSASRSIGDICPECGEASFLNIEGCRKCHQCGYSEC